MDRSLIIQQLFIIMENRHPQVSILLIGKVMIRCKIYGKMKNKAVGSTSGAICTGGQSAVDLPVKLEGGTYSRGFPELMA